MADFMADPMAAAVGRFTIAFSAAEHSINRLIQHLMGLEPPQGNFVTAQIMNLSARLNILVHLGQAKVEAADLRDDLSKIISGTKILNARRNMMLHSAVVGYRNAHPNTEDHREPVLTYYNIKADQNPISDSYALSKSYIDGLKEYAARIDVACVVLTENLEIGRRAVTPPSLDRRPEPPPKDHVFPGGRSR
jgi:hypothetical protein